MTLQLATVFILRADDIGEVAFTRVNREATAFSPDGRVRLQAGGILLYVPYLDGTPTRGDLLVVFDPTTKHYLWRERTHSPRGAFNLELLNGLAGNPWRAFFSSTDSITWWHAWNTDIEVQTSTDVAKDLDDALARALSELRDGWDAHYSKAECSNCRKVDFGEGVDATFWVDPFAVSAAPANLLPRIEDINLVDHGYRIRLSNRRTNSLPRLATALDACGAQCSGLARPLCAARAAQQTSDNKARRFYDCLHLFRFAVHLTWQEAKKCLKTTTSKSCRCCH